MFCEALFFISPTLRRVPGFDEASSARSNVLPPNLQCILIFTLISAFYLNSEAFRPGEKRVLS